MPPASCRNLCTTATQRKQESALTKLTTIAGSRTAERMSDSVFNHNEHRTLCCGEWVIWSALKRKKLIIYNQSIQRSRWSTNICGNHTVAPLCCTNNTLFASTCRTALPAPTITYTTWCTCNAFPLFSFFAANNPFGLWPALLLLFLLLLPICISVFSFL